MRGIRGPEPAHPSDERRRWVLLRRDMKRVLQGSDPIIVGPWLSEVGFELLYWIPFLRWLTDCFEVNPDRLHVVSRGGVATWYEGIASGYSDILDAMSAEDFGKLAEARRTESGGQKQIEFNKWDQRVLAEVAPQMDWSPDSIMHPSLMYRFFQNYWKGAAPLRHILAHTRLNRMVPPCDERWVSRLPDDEYVAVKFYFRPSFPDLPENRRLVSEVVSHLAERTKVVLLNTALELDEHIEADPLVTTNVTTLVRDAAPSENLHVQSIVISRAKAFVGTYGGLAYLAPLYGAPSFGYYSEGEHFLLSHLEFARRTAHALGGSLMTIPSRDSTFLSLLGAKEG